MVQDEYYLLLELDKERDGLCLYCLNGTVAAAVQQSAHFAANLGAPYRIPGTQQCCSDLLGVETHPACWAGFENAVVDEGVYVVVVLVKEASKASFVCYSHDQHSSRSRHALCLG